MSEIAEVVAVVVSVSADDVEPSDVSAEDVVIETFVVIEPSVVIFVSAEDVVNVESVASCVIIREPSLFGNDGVGLPPSSSMDFDSVVLLNSVVPFDSVVPFVSGTAVVTDPPVVIFEFASEVVVSRSAVPLMTRVVASSSAVDIDIDAHSTSATHTLAIKLDSPIL